MTVEMRKLIRSYFYLLFSVY